MSHFVLHDIIEIVLADHAPIANSKGLEIISDWSKVVVYSDPALLEVVLRNVVGNSLRFTDAGHIHIQIEPAGDTLELSVTDTGIGIPEAELENVFNEFYTPRIVSACRAPDSSGSGLGLAIVKRLLTLMSHPFRLESSIGTGTRFSIELPVGRVVKPHRIMHVSNKGSLALPNRKMAGFRNPKHSY